jgi:cobalt-zinc-cadmium efflux system protein
MTSKQIHIISTLLDSKNSHSKHSHHHHTLNDSNINTPRLVFTIVLNFIIPVAQLAGGFLSNSMALISDAIHNFSDLAALIISYIALRIGKKGASKRLTFGYQRAEIIGALLNVAILICAVIFILIEAIGRLNHPEPISGKLVMIMAGIGIAGNGFSALLLYKDSKHNLNIKGAFLHMLGDFFTSLVVLINGAILLFRPWYRLDAILCFLIAAFILKNCWFIIKEAISVLMNATPAGLDLSSVQRYLENRPEIESAHYLHAWNVGNTGIAFSCHITVKDQLVSETEILSEKIRHHLFHKFGIDHPVVQFETATCGNGNLLCAVSSSEKHKI